MIRRPRRRLEFGPHRVSADRPGIIVVGDAVSHAGGSGVEFIGSVLLPSPQ